MTVDPPVEEFAAAMKLPRDVFAHRQAGAVQLILGKDNQHLWPRPTALSRDPVFSLLLMKSKLQGDLVYFGSVGASWRSRRGLTIPNTGRMAALIRKMPVMMVMAVLACLCLSTPVSAFVAYDCSNRAMWWRPTASWSRRHAVHWAQYIVMRE
jgi:hypothetical protein